MSREARKPPALYTASTQPTSAGEASKRSTSIRGRAGVRKANCRPHSNAMEDGSNWRTDGPLEGKSDLHQTTSPFLNVGGLGVRGTRSTCQDRFGIRQTTGHVHRLPAGRYATVHIAAFRHMSGSKFTS